jgi:hypothetical protein
MSIKYSIPSIKVSQILIELFNTFLNGFIFAQIVAIFISIPIFLSFLPSTGSIVIATIFIFPIFFFTFAIISFIPITLFTLLVYFQVFTFKGITYLIIGLFLILAIWLFIRFLLFCAGVQTRWLLVVYTTFIWLMPYIYLTCQFGLDLGLLTPKP